MAKRSVEELEAEKLELEIEERKVKLAREKQAMESQSLDDELRLLELEEKRSQRDSKVSAKARGARDQKDADQARKAVQNACNHHCGGNSGVDIKEGRGYDNAVASVGAVKYPSGALIIHCTRCHKEWSDRYPMGNDGSNKENIYGVWSEGLKLYQKSGINGPRQPMVVGGYFREKLPAA